ncbi:hypothetical protein MJ561_22200 [Klebsiella pneumoniae]|nr:hypothetical protein MJ561_22200 [Klebsiella pneumoniae]
MTGNVVTWRRRSWKTGSITTRCMALPTDSAAAQRPDCGGRRSDPGNLRLLAVRPASALGETTRIMFADPGLGESESRAIFVDPVALRVKAI